MKKEKKLIVIVGLYITFSFFNIFFLPINSCGQKIISRGADADEIYVVCPMYSIYGGQVIGGFMHSLDNGQSFSIQYKSQEINPPLGDATPGVVYQQWVLGDLLVSFDYGITWQITDSSVGTDKRYASGCTPGEIYMYSICPNISLKRSIDYGNTFVQVNDQVFGFPEVGTEPEEIFLLTSWNMQSNPLYILRSYDHGASFDTVELDSLTSGFSSGIALPGLYRGAIAGELYLVTWHTPFNYYIYYSDNYGNSFELKYMSGFIDYYYWDWDFDAGREPGTFYVSRIVIDTLTFDHFHLYIDYSQDYGQTFTTYFHDLDSTYTSAHSILKKEPKGIEISVFPNPLTEYATVSFEMPAPAMVDLSVYNLSGKLVKGLMHKFVPTGSQKIRFIATMRTWIHEDPKLLRQNNHHL